MSVLDQLEELVQESNIPGKMCFIGLKEAFGSLDGMLLSEVIACKGVPPLNHQVYSYVHEDVNTRIQLDDSELSE